MNRIRVYGVTCVLMLLAAAASATTIIMPTDEALVAKSPVIVSGTVISSVPVSRGNAIWTETLLAVGSRIKGDAGETIVIREAGGVLDDRITKIFGSPEYKAGEQVLVFLTPTSRGDYQTIDLFAGKFELERAVDGTPIWIRAEAEANVEVLTPEFEAAPPADVHRHAQKFERYVHERVAGGEGDRDYFVPARGQKFRAEADFTLIDEPTVYRWFAFDQGSIVAWKSSGTQSGYSGGGANELRTAMSSWTGYSEARILYRYDGSFSTAPGGLSSANGINEVLLGDPLGEITGSWDASAGGVVGRGGFNGVSSRRDWTSPFTADSSHQGNFRAWNITEGNLVIQDGVSPANGISSSRLAEIIAHEFGHTLGFGHSADRSALMYASVTGAGPSLRADDQLAARWLYPNPTSTTPPPAVTIPSAPTGLNGSPSGKTVSLQWNDNANNELGQSVYYAASTGSFMKVADLPPNSETAALTGFSDGSWRFYVVAFNAAGESAKSNTITVTISTAPAVPLVASFTWTPDSPVAEDPVLFTDTSTGGVTSRLWNFGEGTSSSQATPVKRYSMNGKYTVSLTVYRGSESRVLSRSITIAARAPATPEVEPYRSLIPVSAQSEGVGGSLWRTELTLFNAGAEGVNANLVFVPQAGGAVQSRSIFISPRQSAVYANALRDLFGMSVGSGAITIEATGATTTPQLKVTSRTFNDATGGTYGLAVPDIFSSDLPQTLYIAGLATTTDYRTNIGLVNRSGSALTAALTLYRNDGDVLAETNVTVPANLFRQETLATFFPAVANRNLAGMSMRVVASAANALSAYGSVVDNRTHDPLYIGAVGVPSMREAVIPIAGRVPGANLTFWRSDLTMFNPHSSTVWLTVQFSNRTKSVTLSPRQTVVLPDVIADLGLSSGVGTLEVLWSGDRAPIVTTRNYTQSPDGGTYGQSIDPVAAFSGETYIAGLRSDSSFRANLGFVNGGSQPITVQARLYTAQGTQAGTATIPVAAGEVVQTSIGALFPGANGAFTLHVTSSASTMFAYGSVIDNASGDPVFYAGR
jgi:PKD repeat protein